MADTLHILNGDATVPEFKKSGIDGVIVVWREALSDGPVSDPIGEDSFWRKRAAYIEEELGGEGYEDKMLSELNKIRDLSAYDKVVLWFEFDLFCQVNMLACLNFIGHDKISLVCLGDEIDGQLRGLGEIGAKDFVTLYDQRTQLTREDMAYARKAWMAYTHASPEKLRILPSSSTFHHLNPAIEAHFQRLPAKNGLNQIEEKMLMLINEGVTEARKLVGLMLRDQGYFGLGDMQYFHYLKQIKTLVGEEKLVVNEHGKRILSGLDVFPQPNQYIGGVFRPDFHKEELRRLSNS